MDDTERWQKLFARFLTGNTGPSGEQKAFCPLHEDPDVSDTPSASFNWGMGVWNCLVCSGGGRIKKLVRDMRAGVRVQVEKEEKPDNVRSLARGKELPSEEQIQLWHERLLQIPEKLQKMTQE